MPFSVHASNEGLSLKLSGELTIRHAQDLARCLAASSLSEAKVAVHAGQLEDADTSILQLLVSLKRTAHAFSLEEISPMLAAAVDRAGLRRELLSGSKELA